MCNYEERYINFREVFNEFYAAERLQNSISIFGDLVSLLSDGRTALFAVKRMKNDLAYIRKADFELSVLEGELLSNSAANVPSIPPTGYYYPLNILLPELRRISKKVRWDKDELDMDWDKEANFIENDGSIRESFGPVAEYAPLIKDLDYDTKRWHEGSEYFDMYVQYLPGSGRCRFLSLAFPDAVRLDFHYVHILRELAKLYNEREWQHRYSQQPMEDFLKLEEDFKNLMWEAQQKDPNPADWVEKKSDPRSLLENELKQVLDDIENEVRPEITSGEIVDLREIFRP